MLDCDSITQVKSKILSAVYKNTPFSLRPPVQEIDLEWQCGQDAHVVLQDFDLTSKEELGLKRVNTLRHYGIRNKAVVSLVPRSGNKLNFFLFALCENSLICLEGKSMSPHRGDTILFRSSQQLPRLRLGPSTRLVHCFRNYRDTRTQSGVPR